MSTFEPAKTDPDAMQQGVPPYNQYGGPMPGYQQAPYVQPVAPPQAMHPMHPPNAPVNNDDDNDSDAGSRAPGTGIPTEYLDLQFESCFHEDKSTRTIPQLYIFMSYMYKYTKLCVYNFFVILLGILMAFIWAILYGFVMFYITYLWSPALRLALILVNTALPLVTEPLRAFLSPLADVAARVFRQIRIKAKLNGGLLSPLVQHTSV